MVVYAAIDVNRTHFARENLRDVVVFAIERRSTRPIHTSQRSKTMADSFARARAKQSPIDIIVGRSSELYCLIFSSTNQDHVRIDATNK